MKNTILLFYVTMALLTLLGFVGNLSAALTAPSAWYTFWALSDAALYLYWCHRAKQVYQGEA